jgi:hypothetical protein
MGLYFPRTPRTIRDALSGAVTWREYMSALSAAAEPGAFIAAAIHPDSPVLPPAVHRSDNKTEPAFLRGQLRRRPRDETVHRRLGLGHLARGQIGPAVGHLEIALRLNRLQARRAVGLTDALRLQCEAATLRLVLMRLYRRLGNEARARSLAQEAQAVL